MTKAELTVVADGRFLCVQVTNLGPPAAFSGVVQPGRGTASAAIIRAALWNDATSVERHLDTGESALIRVAVRDRTPAANEDDSKEMAHPEGTQAWRMCYLKKGLGAALERVCDVGRRDGSTDHDGIVLTVIGERFTATKSIALEGNVAIDLDSNERFEVLDSARHYFAKK